MKNLILAILFLTNFAFAATKVPLGSGVSGTLPIANGGTNNASMDVTAGRLPYADGTKLITLAPGSAGQVLQSTGTAVQWAASAGGVQNYITNGDAEIGTTGWSTYQEADSVTFTDATDLVTLSSHGLSNSDMVSFTSIVSTTGGIGVNTLYWVTVLTSNTFQISTTQGGAPQILTNNGTGSMVRYYPKTGSGGSPGSNIAIARSTSSPLAGVGSFTLTKAAVSAMGYGYTYPFTIDAKDKAKILNISFEGQVVSGTFVPGSPGNTTSLNNSDLTAWIYDVTNSKLIQPSSFKILSNSTTLSERFTATFQTSSDSVSYRLILHHSVPTTAASVYKLDSVVITPSTYAYGTPVTDWVTYTNSCNGSWVTNTTYSCKKRRVGDNYEYHVAVTLSGAPTATTLLVNIPDTIDTTKLASTNAFAMGSVLITDGATTYWHGQVIPNGNTQVIPLAILTSSTYGETQSIQATTPFTFGSGDAVQLRFSIPIVGLSSSVQMSTSLEGREITASYYGSNWSAADGTWATAGNWVTKITDTVGMVNATTGLITIPSAGPYDINVAAAFGIGGYTSNAVFNARVQVNGATNYVIDRRGFISSSTPNNVSGLIRLDLKAGDTVAIQLMKTNWGGASGLEADATQTRFSITKASNPQTIAATESINASYTGPAGVTIPHNSTVIIDFATKEFDSHSAVTTGAAWKFTAPTAGVYEVNASMVINLGGGWAFAEEATLYVYKNGSIFSRLASYIAQVAHSTYIPMVGSPRLVRLNAGDYVDIRLYQSSGASVTSLGGVDYTWANIKRVGN